MRNRLRVMWRTIRWIVRFFEGKESVSQVEVALIVKRCISDIEEVLVFDHAHETRLYAHPLHQDLGQMLVTLSADLGLHPTRVENVIPYIEVNVRQAPSRVIIGYVYKVGSDYVPRKGGRFIARATAQKVLVDLDRWLLFRTTRDLPEDAIPNIQVFLDSLRPQ